MIVLLATGFAYRLLWFWVSASPLTPGSDADRYITNALVPDGLFSDIAAPAGYSMFLHVVAQLPEHSTAIALAQHLLGLVTAWLVWLLGRRIADRVAVSRWWAVPAVVFAVFSGDLTFYSHTLMTETLSFFLFVLSVVIAERLTLRQEGPADLRRLALLGFAFGLVVAVSQLVRTANGPVGIGLLILTLIWVAGLRGRTVVVATAALAAALTMGAYVTAVDASKHKLSGLGGIEGWMLYARTSSFADCKKAPPPSDLRDLCDTVPVAERYGAFAYPYNRPDIPEDRLSKAVLKYGGIPTGNDDLRRYSINVLKHQPLDYVAAVMRDLRRYVAPNAGHVPWFSTPGPEFQEITNLDPHREGTRTHELLEIERYTAGPLASDMEAWMDVSRFPPLLFLVCLFLPAGVLIVERRREVAATFIPVWLAGITAAVLPVALVAYEYRYVLPTQIVLAVIGPIGAGLLVQRAGLRIVRQSPSRPPADGQEKL